ncbi:hypothetical protein SAMN05421770_10174 [Granulicella rosea]|uniref:Uncharacterized protein n=1 Tax=Granulicella rosea TaxID=474952 RepID=A0A239CSC2_9BACT|nr:hypothetical protein [Granulicella rosea]SNS22772.1 hypothetical protein SAMN05421770_10174 [Granulicella rosea]
MEEQQTQQERQNESATTKAAVVVDRATEAEKKRKVQALVLQRERILSERTASPHRRSALANALATIEEDLAQLGWTLHL